MYKISFYFSTRTLITSFQRNFHVTLRAMGAYDAEFSNAKERLNNLKEDPGNDVKLKIYALFKQVCLIYKDKFKKYISSGESEKGLSVYKKRRTWTFFALTPRFVIRAWYSC